MLTRKQKEDKVGIMLEYCSISIRVRVCVFVCGWYKYVNVIEFCSNMAVCIWAKKLKSAEQRSIYLTAR